MSARNLRNLAKRLERYPRRIEREAVELVKVVAFNILLQMVRATPVDTSTAVSNWQASLGVGGSRIAEIDAFFEGRAGSTRSASMAAAIAAARAEISKLKKSGVGITISNVVDYIEILDKGTVNSPPANFIEKAKLSAKLSVALHHFEI